MLNDIAPEEVGFSRRRLRLLDDALARRIDAGLIAGGVALVARRGRIAHVGVAGMADLDAGRPMQLDTIVEIQSMTKPITAVATMTLFEEGRFLLDDPVSDYLPEFAETTVYIEETATGIQTSTPERPMTIRHLLLNTAGFTAPDYTDPVMRLYAAEYLPEPHESLAEYVRRLAGFPLVHHPGTRWTYGVAYAVLGRVLEVIAGQPLDDILRARVFEPLGMVDTGYQVASSSRERVAQLYEKQAEGGRRLVEPQKDPTAQPVLLSGSSRLYSTASDYLRFCQMLLNGGTLDRTHVLGRKTVELMLANHWPSAWGAFPAAYLSPGESYGFGGAIVQDVAATGLPASAGTYSWGGWYSTFFWIDPAEALAGILMFQFVPMQARLMELFQVLTYQALVD